MMNVMIVEDSKPILRNIKTLLEAMELPLRIVATAANGEEALEMIRREPVHILLTDIRMPKMDGLTLIEQVKQLSPQLKVILISGYSDFEYTRKALNLQVFDYLLKPVERKALAEVMERAIDQLNQQLPREWDQLKKIVDPVYGDMLWKEKDFTPFAKLMVVLRKQPFSLLNKKEVLDKVQTALQGLSVPQPCLVLPAITSQEVIVLMNRTFLDRYSSVYECLEGMRNTLKDQGLDVMVGGQLLHSELEELSELYYRISAILQEHQRLTQGIVMDTAVPVYSIGPGGDYLDAVKATEIVQMISGQKKEQFIIKFNEQIAKWTDSRIRVTEVKRIIGLMVDTFAHLLEERGAGNRSDLEMAAKQLFKVNSYEDFCNGLQEWTKGCFKMLQTSSRKSGHELFNQMNEYVQMNLYSQLSINDIALKFYVSPSYISRIIKKHTQITFVQYYTRLKINEACQLLEERPNLKFKELSDLLSFSDQHYFSKVFKDYTGFSPTEYKEQKVTLSQ